MDPEKLRHYFDAPETANDWMQAIGVIDMTRGLRNLQSMATCDPNLEVFAPFMDQLCPLLRWTADPDMVLNNLERFFRATRSPMTLMALLLHDKMSLAMLLEIFATSQYLGDMLISEPELFETIRQTDGKLFTSRRMTDELVEEIMAFEKEGSVLRALRRFKRRQTLRIAFNDMIKKQSLEMVTRQISRVAESAIEAALHAAGRKLFTKRGTPRSIEGVMAHFVVLALGKLGGRELNYSSDIDLIFLYDQEGMTDPGQDSIQNFQYFSELGREIVRFLSEQTELGSVYRVDMKLRPDGKHGPLAIGLEEALLYYDHRGRTWERQAFIKARPVAGNIGLGEEFLRRLQPWIYRHNLTQADIAGIRTLKRKIERNAQMAGDELLNVKTGYGGIRDIEFMIQFLQLLHGGEIPELRVGNTLIAIERLEQHRCLNAQERDLLIEGYRFLRKIEHRLQIMFDLQTHVMPANTDERRKLALRMGYHDMSWQTALDAFNADFQFITGANRRMLNHLLVNAFHDNEETAAEVDLLLDSDPEESRIVSVLEKYRFRDPVRAYHLLTVLMDEKNPYLSAHRCRHFLVAIAPELLAAMSTTPDPQQTLSTLSNVADALGAKGGLWELFSFNPPSLQLFVRLCAGASFLTDLLCGDPGILDALMDSLVLDLIPPRNALDYFLTKLCNNAQQIEPILSGFKNDRMLLIGTREIMGRSTIKETTEALADLAQIILKQIIIAEYRELVKKHGVPHKQSSADDAPNPCELAVVALGKFGGREMHYHSDLDVVFLFESHGMTAKVETEETEKKGENTGEIEPVEPVEPVEQNVSNKQMGQNNSANQIIEPIDNQTFFNKLTQRVVKRGTQFGVHGKLYSIDLRLRPLGKGGALATPLENAIRYFDEGSGELWERQMLCKARVVFHSGMLNPPLFDEMEDTSDFAAPLPQQQNLSSTSLFSRRIMEAIRSIQNQLPFENQWREDMRLMRKKLVDTSSDDQLKRGIGGTLDVEFIVQMLQLKFGNFRPGICVPNTFDAIDKLYAVSILDEKQYCILRDGYRFLRRISNFLCLMNLPSTKHLPKDEKELQQLAFLMEYPSNVELIEQFQQTRQKIAECFEHFFTKV
ncbi:MAG: bifunctional [glutamate--ammonia ligase]-adenylyl-L-tyrosine phosphorylase/[glutamate--ammonia-ligase] adenylyltransferase [Thermoguttaceae bacterium]